MNGGICPCDTFVHPQVIINPPGQNTLAYRVGDYLAFREALLRSRPGEVELTNWRPGAQGDLAVQMVEWWAYLADILTFYNERIANEDYLRTSVLPDSVQRLIRILGYRPRPGIGATGTLAALMNGIKPFTLPQGFQVQSKPGPGKQPQIFELTPATMVSAPDVISADPPPKSWVDGDNSVLLQGVVGGINPGDELLVLERNWKGQDTNCAPVTVKSVAQVKDPRGAANTKVSFNESISNFASAPVENYRLLRSAQSAHVWQYPATTVSVIGSNTIDLDAITRGIKVGDPVLLEIGNSAAPRGIYFSPNGYNLGGGGKTVSVGIGGRTVVKMVAYQTGVITAFDDGGIYYSPDGQNLAGGGNTVQVYSGNRQVLAMVAYAGGVMTAFDDGTVYSSPDGKNLGGGRQTTQSYGGPFTVATLVPFQTGVIVSFNDGMGSIFYSSDGSNLYGASATTQLLIVGPSGDPPLAMVPYGPNVITVLPDEPYVSIYRSSGLNLLKQSLFTERSVSVQAIIPYGNSGIIAAVFSYPTGPTGMNTIYYSATGESLQTATQVYSGQNLVVAMIPYRSGVLTAFDDGNIYYSPDGTNLKGGGNTVQVFGPGPLAVSLFAYGSGVFTDFPVSQLLSVNSYQEAVWFANPTGGDPTNAPTGSPPPIAIPIPHTRIGFTPSLPGSITDPSVEPGERPLALLRYAWKDVGTLIALPSPTLSGTQISLLTPLPASLLPLTNQDVLISDNNGNGVEAAATASAGDPSTLGLSSPSGPSDSTWASMLSSLNLAAPLNVLFNLLPVTRGKTVANEILGSGDATIATGQEFVLQKSPLTYLQSANSTSGSGYQSTLQVWVDGVQWQEVPSLYGQGPNAQVFVTREDEQNMTHVQFGDGVDGARLPSGVNNVVASYRVGSGAEAPDAGSLTVILKSWPGLKAVLNPVPVGGGADPDPPAQIKTYAAQSVLTFGRAISSSDYEAIAAQAPGVARARAYWTWDATQQRMMVKVYVGNDANAVSSAKQALAGASDPNRPLSVILAQSVPITLQLTLVVDPNYALAGVVPAATAALVDPTNGLLGSNVVEIGESIFQSQIYGACLNVAGVRAVHSLTLGGATAQTCSCCPDSDYRFDSGEGGFFQVTTPADQIISTEVAANVG